MDFFLYRLSCFPFGFRGTLSSLHFKGEMTRPGLSFIMKIFPNIAGPKMLPYPNSSTLCKMCTTCDLSFVNNLIVLTHWPKTGPLDLE